MDVLFLDKDKTLGDFKEDGLYPGVIDFLTKQKNKERKLYIATTANNDGKKHLSEVEGVISGYFGNELIDATTQKYCLSNGEIRNILNDYCSRISMLPIDEESRLMEEAYERGDRLNDLKGVEKEKLQQEINAFFNYWRALLHKETEEPFDERSRYGNPYLNDCRSMKDLFLAKRLISPLNYDSIRSVMVGDNGDTIGYYSDPETPLIVISKEVRNGKWNIVENIVDLLFSDKEKKLWQVFDEIYGSSKGIKISNEKKEFESCNIRYKLKSEKFPEDLPFNIARIVYCK